MHQKQFGIFSLPVIVGSLGFFVDIYDQLHQKQEKTQRIFYAIASVFIFLFFALKVGGSATNMYLIRMGLGFGSGISVLYITMSAEQFGTNLRATASISIPNFVRGLLPFILFLFQVLRSKQY